MDPSLSSQGKTPDDTSAGANADERRPCDKCGAGCSCPAGNCNCGGGCKCGTDTGPGAVEGGAGCGSAQCHCGPDCQKCRSGHCTDCGDKGAGKDTADRHVCHESCKPKEGCDAGEKSGECKEKCASECKDKSAECQAKCESECKEKTAECESKCAGGSSGSGECGGGKRNCRCPPECPCGENCNCGEGCTCGAGCKCGKGCRSTAVGAGSNTHGGVECGAAGAASCNLTPKPEEAAAASG